MKLVKSRSGQNFHFPSQAAVLLITDILRMFRIKTAIIVILNKQKCHFFSFPESENGRAEQVLPWGAATSGRGEKVWKGNGKVNMAQILCTHVCK
jgi:hypothetical protein